MNQTTSYSNSMSTYETSKTTSYFFNMSPDERNQTTSHFSDMSTNETYLITEVTTYNPSNIYQGK